MKKPRTGSRVSRREVLAGLGASAALAPFIPLLNADGQEATAPKRLVLLWTPHGTVYENWTPTGDTSNFTLPRILEPLNDYKAKINVLDGLQITHSNVPAPPHTEGMSLVWTGSHLGAGDTFMIQEFPVDWVTGASVDQIVAQTISAGLPYQSLEFGLRSGGEYPGSRMIYSAPRTPLSPEENPWRAFSRLFSAMPTNAAEREQQMQLNAERRSVLDVVNRQVTRLSPRVSTADRFKIDAHLTALRATERRLQNSLIAECSAPMIGAEIDPYAVDNTPAVFDHHLENIVAALACDLTRVASLQFKFGDNDNDPYPWIGIDEGHHDISHKGDSDLDAVEHLTQISTWYAQKFAYLVKLLDEVPEGNGSMLDNTLVVWGSELGKGNSHSFEKVPFVLAGGAGGAIPTGRVLRFNGDTHNRLLVSICNAMGLTDIDTFGTTDTGNGGLSGLV